MKLLRSMWHWIAAALCLAVAEACGPLSFVGVHYEFKGKRHRAIWQRLLREIGA